MSVIGRKMKLLLIKVGQSILLAMLMLCAPAAYSASKTILVLGDSLSAEYGLPRGSGWVTLLEQRLKQDKIAADIVNASISGETTSGGRGRLPSLLKRHSPDFVIIELGANDGLRGLPLDATEENLRSMVKASQQAGTRVLLVGMQLPPNYGSDYTQRFATMYSKLAKELDTALVPFLFEEMNDKPDMFQADRIHPTVAAQPLMLQAVYPRLKPLLTDKQ
jgi:acyl-CoA thioesterase-1